jgi:dihydrofolate reductase
VDGYFTGKNGDISWAHKSPRDEEWNAFVEGNASGEAMLLFGRVTYQMMAGYWPSPLACKNNPEVADRMNTLSKVVFSRTMDKAAWQNTTLIKDGMADEVRRLKRESGKDMVILGSGSIVSQLAREGLVDEFQIVVSPIVLGAGRTMFEGTALPLRLTKTRSFGNGCVLLCYEL